MDYKPTHKMDNYKVSRRNHRKISLQSWVGKDFPRKAQKALTAKKKRRIGKSEFMKVKHVQKTLLERINRQATDWENMFATHTSDQTLAPKIYKEYLQLNNNF